MRNGSRHMLNSGSMIDHVEAATAAAEPGILALDVDGMMCQKNCGSTVQRALEAFPGVLRAEVSFPARRAWVWATDRVACRPDALAEALEDIGFGARPSPDIELMVTVEGGPHGGLREAYGGLAEEAMRSVPGVVRAEAFSEEGRARAWTAGFDGGGGKGGRSEKFLVDVGERLVKALESAGFRARVFPDGMLEVDGMMCQRNCGTTVRKALESVPGVARAEVSFAERRAKVWALDGPRLPLSILVDTVESVGFEAKVVGASGRGGGDGSDSSPAVQQQQQQQQEKGEDDDDDVVEVQLSNMLLHGEDGKGLGESRRGTAVGVFSVSGMSCASCVGNVERFVSGLEGVEDVRVALLAEKAEVRFDPDVMDGQRLAQSITELGYRSRHLSTAFVSAGEGSQADDAGEQCVSLEVSGVFESACVARLEAAVLDLPGVISCALTPALHGNGENGSGSNGYPTAAPTAAIAGDEGNRYPYASPPYVLEASLSRVPRLPQPAPSTSPSSDSGSDAVWTALREAYDPEGRRKVAGVRDILEAVQGLGYEARLLGAGAGAGGGASAIEFSQAAEVAEWRRLLMVAVAVTAPVLIIHAMDKKADGGHVTLWTVFSWMLVTVMQVVVGRRFYRNAYKAARHGSFGMDMLVVVGTSVSYLYSTLALLLAIMFPEGDATGNGGNPGRPHLFLESPAMLLTFICLGKFLEVVAKRKTSQALVLLLKAQPHRAILVEPENMTAPSSIPDETRLHESDDLGAGDAEAESVQGWRERSIEAALVQPGDVLRVFPGAQFPSDGTLVAGSTYVDESMITGESIPVAKGEGDTVVGGTANQHGSVFVRTDRVGEDTMLAQLCRLVEEAQMSKAPIQRQADRVASVFVPTVMVLSLITFLAWFLAGEAGIVPEDWLAEERSDAFLFALLFGVSVVVVACPCALGLATPTAVMVGTGVGAGNGVLIKGGAALEAAHRVNTVVFDKTGTLTEGRPFVTDVVPVNSAALDRLVGTSAMATVRRIGAEEEINGDPKEASFSSPGTAAAFAVLAVAAACEAGSEHPVGRAIIQAAEAFVASSGTGAGAAGVKTTDFVSEPGRGVACEHPLGRVCVGNRTWAETDGGRRKWVAEIGGRGIRGGPEADGGLVDTLGKADGVMRGLEEAGKTAVIVTLDGEAVGVIAVADADKQGSRRAVLALERMGLDVWVVTGDNRRVAAALARRLGVAPHRVMAEVLPAEKARKVADLQLNGGCVAMVGDGVNDAPALATADVGIAVGAGTQVAMEAADMVLVRSDVCDVVSALHLGRKVFGRIRLNFLFAMVYNLCGVPIAAGVFYPILHIRVPPALAGLTMALSSMSVVLSSLALRLYRKPKIDEDGRLWEASTASIMSEAFAADGCIGRYLRWRRSTSPRFVAVGGQVENVDGGSNGWFSSNGGAESSDHALDWVYKVATRAGPYALVRTRSGGSGRTSRDAMGRGGESGAGQGGDIELVGHFV